MPWMKQTPKRVYDWFERRLQIEGPVKDAVLHKVPRNTASWWYVFGSAAFTLLMLQVVTGILLALVYVPSAAEAWNSLNILNHQIPLGWFLRALHGWGSNFMVAIVFIHMAQVFLFGAYKFPRELTWLVGVILLLCTLGMAFTGQVLRFDQDAYWGLGIGVFILSRVPWMGGGLVHFLLGGPVIAGATLSRFFALHVFIIPGLLIFLALIHVWMVIKLGINEWPMPGRLVRRATYIAEYNKLSHDDGIPFVPGAFWKDLVFSAAVIAAVGVCAIVFGPYGPGGQPDPSIIQTVPKPDFPFLWFRSEGPGLLRRRDRRGRRLRHRLRALRPRRPARSVDHPDRPQAGLPLPLDLRDPLLFATVTGDALHSGGADPDDRRAARCPVRRGGGRKELASTPRRRPGADLGRRFLGSVYAPRHIHTLEPAHDGVEQRDDSRPLSSGRHAARAPGRDHL